jgi:hypothetical protein
MGKVFAFNLLSPSIPLSLSLDDFNTWRFPENLFKFELGILIGVLRTGKFFCHFSNYADEI